MKSVIHEYMNTEMAAVRWPVAMKYPMKGVDAILVMVKILGTVQVSLETRPLSEIGAGVGLFSWWKCGDVENGWKRNVGRIRSAGREVLRTERRLFKREAASGPEPSLRLRRGSNEIIVE